MTQNTKTTAKGTRTRDYSINPFDILTDQEYCPLVLEGNEVKRSKKPVYIDSLLLISRISEVDRTAVRMFLYLVSQLEDSAKPIIVHSTVIKLNALLRVQRTQFHRSKHQLINAGLITSPKPHVYYINPLFVWTDGAERLFNPAYIPQAEPPQPEPTPAPYTGKKRGRPRKSTTE